MKEGTLNHDTEKYEHVMFSTLFLNKLQSEHVNFTDVTYVTTLSTEVNYFFITWIQIAHNVSKISIAIVLTALILPDFILSHLMKRCYA